jgi:phosphoglycolate phosphatase-like HAD superfamily hydrolase
MPPVILWDIDGTLVRSNGGRVSVTAFLNALKTAAAHPDDFDYPKDAGGKTDEQIALEVLALAKIAEDRALELLADFREYYRIELEREQHNLVGDLRVLPGVEDTLRTFQERGVMQTLLTGNLESIARLKLACAGLDRYVDFELGAYGSDARDRTTLVPISKARIRAKTGLEPDPVIVVGDTPRDVACARAGQAVAVAVATAFHTRDQLEAAAPDLVLDDLTNGAADIEKLLNLATALQ